VALGRWRKKRRHSRCRLRAGKLAVRFPAAKSLGASDNEAMAMTEQEWLAATRPYDLTHYKACRDPRKRRLLSCAFARRVLSLVPDDRYRQAVDKAEGYADGLVTQKDMRTERTAMKKLWNKRNFSEAGNHAATAALCTLSKEAVMAVHALEPAASAQASVTRRNWDAAHDKESRAQIELIRDIFGNPFRPVTVNPAWRTSNVTALAQSVYDERAFDRLPILADALEDAGCDNQDILNHCRQPDEHVRGCWVVDLILGKE
jgi:hypothetical protein